MPMQHMYRQARLLKWVAPFAALILLLMPSAALAHPLGNFTVNRYSRLEVGDSQAQLVDIAVAGLGIIAQALVQTGLL